MKRQLLTKIHDHSATVAVIGLGYVGLPLAAADCVVVVTDHSVYDWRQLAQMPVAVVDTRHVIG